MMLIFACVLAFALSLALTFPIRMIIAPKFGFMDIPKDNRRMHKVATPLIGGLGIYIAFTVASLVFGFAKETLPYIIGGGIIVLCGIADDKFSIRPIFKILCQIVAGIILCVFGVTLNQICVFGHILDLGIFAYPITVIWVIGITNSLNLIDGMDGLCSGITVIAAGGAGLVALTNGNMPVFVCAMILMCSGLGFLPHNIHPAKIFLGDTGSMFFGFILAALTVDVTHLDNGGLPSLVTIALIGVPFFDTTYAIIRRLIRRKKIMEGDKEHVHHVLSRKYSHSKTVLLMYMASIFCVGIALVMTGGFAWEIVGYGLFLLAVAYGVLRFAVLPKLRKSSEATEQGTEAKPENSVNTDTSPEN